MAQHRSKPAREPLLEWISAAVGLVLTLGIVVLIGKEWLNGETGQPPAIEVVAGRVTPVQAGFVVEVTAINHSGGSAAGVEVEGALMSGATPVETSGLTFDYVPGRAERKGGLYFTQDPRRHRLQVRALGYQEP
jgi:uncharacterized protein (TIGR02588 family)